ncbi:hypothetical protein ACEPAH_1407 [Sanghuangporus vaninii]
MTWGFLALPNELKVHIINFMFPILTQPMLFFNNANLLDEDIDGLFPYLKDLRNFAATCKHVLSLCMMLLFRAEELKFNDERVLVTEHINGTLPIVYQLTHFLALDGTRHHANICDNDSDDMEIDAEQPNGNQIEAARSKPLDLSSIRVTELERSVARVFKHFRSVRILDLADFPISLMNLWNLKLLKSLQILSVRSPGTYCDLIPNVQMIHSVCTLPRVSALNLVMHGLSETEALSNVVKLFERTVRTLSIKGIDYGDGDNDYLSAILFNSVHHVNMPNLKHINIDFLEHGAKGLRHLVMHTPSLESILVDCRGIAGFLPLFYAIDLIRIVTREPFDLDPMMNYDAIPVGFHHYIENDEHLAHYKDQSMIWTSRLSRISCNFAVMQTPAGSAKVLEKAEFFFAVSDGYFNPIIQALAFHELLEVFRGRAFTFRAVKDMIIATDEVDDFEPPEEYDQLKELTANICRSFLPSAKDVKVRWGVTKPFHWTPGEIREMEVDNLWSF